MTGFRIPPPPRLRRTLTYPIATLLPLLALLVERGLRSWVEPIPFVLFFFVVSLAASLGGWGPGFLSVALSSLCGWHFLATSPVPDRAAGALVGALVFAPVASVIAAFGALVRTGFLERENAAAELREAVRVRDDFISVASHELKTPLTALSLVIQRLARRATDARGGGDEDLPRLIDSAHRQTSRLNALVNNLLDVSRIRSGRMHLDLAEVDLVGVVRDGVEHFAGDSARSGPLLSLHAEGPLVGRWDRVRIEQVLTNLLMNAVKYGAGSPITVTIRRDGETAVLTVSDNGIGIPLEDHDRIFERFARGPHGGAPGGFGIGLWIVREIASALGGTVRVTSAPGEGAAFTVVLPLAGP
jgi:two-component system OmpR family sensor kinase